MAKKPKKKRQPLSNGYELFILLMTVLSLLDMAALFWPGLTSATKSLLLVYDNAACLLFLCDFGLRWRHADSGWDYFLHKRGWLDLLGSIPALGVFKLSALLRLARLSRVARAVHMFRSQDRRGLVADVLANRGEYAGLVATAAVITVLTVSSVLVLQAESKVSGANIVTGGDSLWWAVVTLTTVGYGNLYPVTAFGRVVSVFVMFAGVGIIGALASIMASLLIPTPKAAPAAASGTTRDEQLDEVLRELKEIRQMLSAGRQNASDAS